MTDDSALDHAARERGDLAWVRLSAFVVLFLGLSFLYFRTVFGSLDAIQFCCDAVHYLHQSRVLIDEGPLADNPFGGYRSYLSYLLVYLIQSLGGLFVTDLPSPEPGSVTSTTYAYGSFLLFFLSGIALLAAFHRRAAFPLVFFPLYASPFVFAHVPYPLQEGQAVLLLLPMVVTLLLMSRRRTVLLAAVAGLLAGAAWMVKASNLLLVPPVLAFAAYEIWRSKEGGRRQGLAAGVLLACFGAVVLPQSLSMLELFGTLDPYPAKAVLDRQLVWGWGAWRYDTLFDPAVGGFKGLFFRTPFAETTLPAIQERVLAEPGVGLAVAVGHVLSAFNYDSLTPYVIGYDPAAFSPGNFVVGAILFLGVTRILTRWLTWQVAPRDVLLDGMIAGTVAILPLLAVETRFTILPLALLTVRAGEAVFASGSKRETIVTWGGAVLFATAFALLSAIMFQTTGMTWPN